MEELDGLRAPLPIRESKREKYNRVMAEVESSAQTVQSRLLEIEQVYKLPLEDIYKKAFFKCHKGAQHDYEARRRSTRVDVGHCVEVRERGQVETLSKAVGDQMPKHFYRTTKLASWRQYRFYHHKGYHGDHLHDPQKPLKHNLHHLEVDDFLGMKNPRWSLTDTYQEFVELIAREVQRARQKELQKERKLRLGSFALLSPFELKETVMQMRRKGLPQDRDHKLAVRNLDVGAAFKFFQKQTEAKLEAMLAVNKMKGFKQEKPEKATGRRSTSRGKKKRRSRDYEEGEDESPEVSQESQAGAKTDDPDQESQAGAETDDPDQESQDGAETEGETDGQSEAVSFVYLEIRIKGRVHDDNEKHHKESTTTKMSESYCALAQ